MSSFDHLSPRVLLNAIKFFLLFILRRNEEEMREEEEEERRKVWSFKVQLLPYWKNLRFSFAGRFFWTCSTHENKHGSPTFL